MCDYGRYRYEWVNRGAAPFPYGVPARTDVPAHDTDAPVLPAAAGPEGPGSAGTRLEEPMMRRDGSLAPVGWQEAIVALVDRLRAVKGGIRVVGSPFHANEDNGLLRRLQEVLGGGDAVYRSPRAPDEDVLPAFPKLTRRRDLAANGRGLEALGFERVGDDDGAGGIEAGGGALLVLGDALADLPVEFTKGAELVVYLGTTASPALMDADFILPITSFAEQEGTFTNFEGRVQRFWPALNPPPMARPAWQVLGVILAGLEDGAAPATAGDAFLRLAELFDAFGGLSYPSLGTRGALINEPVRLRAGEEA
jgi:NADH-quinone oxidoreductase subunit G